MKIAIAGKGGVGKTTVTALLCWVLKDTGKNVLAVDADPDTNLGFVLGFPNYKDIRPIIEMKELIRERMEIQEDNPKFFKLNPKIEDIPDKFLQEFKGIKLIVMGTVKAGDAGCVCPENTFLRRLLQRIVLREDEYIIVDFAAGVEHLGRGTAEKFDHLIIVIEPTQLSLESFFRIYPLAKDIGIKKIWALANRVRSEEDISFIRSHIPKNELLGIISYSDTCFQANQHGNWEVLRKDIVYEQAKEIMRILLAF